MTPGQRDEFETIYNAACDQLLAYLLRRTNHHEALEVLGETWLVAWRRRQEIPANSLPWLIGVARNVLANHRRRLQRHNQLVERLRLNEAPLNQQSIEADLSSSVEAALGRLSPTDREILILVAWDDLKPREAAAAMGWTPATLSVRLHRARKRFSRALDAVTNPEPGLNISLVPLKETR